MLTINAIGIFTRFYSALLCSEYGAHGFPDEEVNKESQQDSGVSH